MSAASPAGDDPERGRAIDANPYAAPATVSAAPPDGPVPAGFWWRVLAEVIDTVVFAPVIVVSVLNLYRWHSPAIAYGQSALYLIYRIGLDRTGGTLGKRLIGLRLVDGAQRAPGARRALLRNVHQVVVAVILVALRAAGYHPEQPASGMHAPFSSPAAIAAAAVSWLSTILWLVIVVFVAARDDKRGLHDLWSGVSCVRRVRAPAPAAAAR